MAIDLNDRTLRALERIANVALVMFSAEMRRQLGKDGLLEIGDWAAQSGRVIANCRSAYVGPPMDEASWRRRVDEAASWMSRPMKELALKVMDTVQAGDRVSFSVPCMERADQVVVRNRQCALRVYIYRKALEDQYCLVGDTHFDTAWKVLPITLPVWPETSVKIIGLGSRQQFVSECGMENCLGRTEYRGAGLQQARCPECDVPLDFVTPHAEGCGYEREQARLMRNALEWRGDDER